MALHLIEFTWFHYSRTVHSFCCTGPIRRNGRRALPAILRYGVRTFLYFLQSSDKVACGTKVQVLPLINTSTLKGIIRL
jgi:hypothetical protein